VIIPIYGWLDADDDHRSRVEKFFHIPMLVLALLVLPVLAIEYLQGPERLARSSERLEQTDPSPAANASSPADPSTLPETSSNQAARSDGEDSRPTAHVMSPEEVRQASWFARIIDHPAMLVATDVALAFIWLAFFFEFVIKIAFAPSRAQYALKNWIDIVIILLPMLRVFRGMRALRALRTAQVARVTQVYRLRGVAIKLMRTAAALVLGLEAVRKMRERLGKPDGQEAPPDYTHWSRASLIAEIQRLKELHKRLEKELEGHQNDGGRRHKGTEVQSTE
jgi:hypothetical protein